MFVYYEVRALCHCAASGYELLLERLLNKDVLKICAYKVKL